jgi:hypothetical protein
MFIGSLHIQVQQVNPSRIQTDFNSTQLQNESAATIHIKYSVRSNNGNTGKSAVIFIVDFKSDRNPEFKTEGNCGHWTSLRYSHSRCRDELITFDILYPERNQQIKKRFRMVCLCSKSASTLMTQEPDGVEG